MSSHSPGFQSLWLKAAFLATVLVFSIGDVSQAADPTARQEDGEKIYRMREYRTNYIIFGQPDTKVQFSFLFQLLRNYKLFGAYTQTMFWDLGRKDSNPFSDINYNPELFYVFDFDEGHLVNGFSTGYSHFSNGEDGEESRGVEALFVQVQGEQKYSFLLPRFEVRFRYFFATDEPNEDIVDYYGPIRIRLYLDAVGQWLNSEEAYFEYYNGGKFADDFSKSSVRLSFRFKVWETEAAPKFFVQYFNGYGENLLQYEKRVESYRLGFSLGGY